MNNDIEILEDRAIIEIQGDDSFNFLQSMITADLKASNYSYSYILNSQGRYLYDFFILKTKENHFILDVHIDNIEGIIQYLNLYKLRAKISLNRDEKNILVIYSKSKLENALFSAKDPRSDLLGFRSFFTDHNYLENMNKKKNLYFQDKYKLAITDGVIDLSYAKSFPLEFGGEYFGAISYNKGCYIGQELISRTKYQGIIRKKIFKIILEKSPPYLVKNASVLLAQKNNNDFLKIGVITSYYNNEAIALLREDLLSDIPCSLFVQNTEETELMPAIIYKPDWR